jgi:hypothetical protein
LLKSPPSIPTSVFCAEWQSEICHLGAAHPLECFANRQSMDIVFNTANALIPDTNNDKGLREWFKSLDVYVHKVSFLMSIHSPI